MIYLVKNKTQAAFATDQLKSLKILGVDTETTGLDPIVDKVLLLTLGNEENQFVFDIARLSEKDLFGIFNILKNNNILKIFQNGKFDYKMLKSNFGIQVKNISDTMINEQLLTKGIKIKGFGLDELSKKYRAGNLNKETRSEFASMSLGDTFTEEQINYAADDVKVLPEIYEKQLEIAISKNMIHIFTLEGKTVPVVAEMELNGIYLDSTKWLSLVDSAKKKLGVAQKKLQTFFEPYFEKDIFGDISLNYNSPVQLKPALEKVLGEQIESTEERYLKHFDHPVVEALFDYRESAKKISTYGEDFLKHIHPITKRIHADYLQLGTDSGRMSCTNPNIQNIPHEQEYRTPFCVQKEDYKIISADFSSQELRVLAQLSGEPTWKKAIEDGRDLHSMIASMTFGLPESKCGKGTEYRTKAKTIGFGTIYGLSAYGLAKQLKISKEEASKLLNTFFKKFPEINKYLRNQENLTKKRKCAISPLDGRRRDLSGLDWDDWRKRNHALNIGKNHPIQG